MSKLIPFPGRRSFLKGSAAITTVLASATGMSWNAASEEPDLFIIGPKKGYSTQIGTLVSEMAFMRDQVLNSV